MTTYKFWEAVAALALSLKTLQHQLANMLMLSRHNFHHVHNLCPVH